MARKTKICGLKDPVNIEAMARLKPDYMGFNFFKGSPRYVGDEFSANTLSYLPPSIKKVGVFVNEPPAKLLEIQNKFNFDLIQLHGTERPEYCQHLFNHGLKIMKSFQLSEDFNFAKLELYQPYCRYFLFDTKSDGYGGSGLSFNWSILENYSQNIPFFLAGGLGIENLEDFTKLSHPFLYGYDFNSKLEITPGIKSDYLSEQLFKEMRKV